MALSPPRIDAASFTLVRLSAGAMVLALLVRSRTGGWAALRGRGLGGPLALVAYAAPFSFAYLRIGAAVGALVLFGMVQLTMIGWGIARGERPTLRTWMGLALAAIGLGALTVPAATRPDLPGVGLMAIAGVAWGAYSLVGKAAADPLAANARSFLLGTPIALILSLALFRSAEASPAGLALAATSGAVTSGLGYAIWYRALRGLTATQAAVVQLCVPVLAALGAVALLGERLNPRLVISGAVVLGGVALVLSARARSATGRA
jgi:drug/metabolite transporter (DMT)-like permease